MPTKIKTSSVHFLTGSDESAVKKAATKLAAELAPGADAFGLEVIDGAVDTVDAAASSIEQAVQGLLTLPFLGGTKLIWLKSASFLSDSVTGRSETVLNALENLCKVLQSGLPDGVQFLLSAPQPDKRRSAYKTLVKLAETQIHDLPDLGFRGGEEAIIEWTTSRVHARDLQLDPDAVETLAARVGLDTMQLESELEKLETAFGKTHAIRASDIRALVPLTREGGIFDLSEAVARRNLPLALETLEQLFRQGEKGVGILLAAIVPTVRNLLLVKDLLVRHKLPPPAQAHFFSGTLKRLPDSAIAHLPRKKDGTLNAYPLGIAAMNASHYALPELEAGFAACADANQQLLSGTMTENVILTRLLIGLLSRKTS
ncbi:MAG TPA: DNA polymerase III subunit delta [Terrimicrobiaceae bacterium]|nr:DNA polymerase III subunit delta [Terrimicrobiaceae bacterium]